MPDIANFEKVEDGRWPPNTAEVAWKDDRGVEHFAPLFRASRDTKAWDSAPEDAMALYHDHHGIYSYVRITVTGYKLTQVLNWKWRYGYRVKIEFGLNSQEEEDKTTASGWVFLRRPDGSIAENWVWEKINVAALVAAA
jgi:hypothetical protein